MSAFFIKHVLPLGHIGKGSTPPSYNRVTVKRNKVLLKPFIVVILTYTEVHRTTKSQKQKKHQTYEWYFLVFNYLGYSFLNLRDTKPIIPNAKMASVVGSGAVTALILDIEPSAHHSSLLLEVKRRKKK